MIRFLTRRRGGARADWTDWAARAYLAVGLLVMFGPVLWLVLSSFKTQAALQAFPPGLLPMGQKQVVMPGGERALPVLTAAAKAFPENFGVLYRLGASLDHLGRTAEAVPYFERALAYALEQLGERERALSCFKQADELEDSEKNA